MLCNDCRLEATQDVIQACQKPICSYKEQPNTSGKIQNLFRVSGSGFIIDYKKEEDA